MFREKINSYKTSLLESYRFCLKVYDEGFENVEQFYSFKQLCQLHVDRCNFYFNSINPIFGKLQYKKYKYTKELKELAKCTIEELSELLNNWIDNYNKTIEETKMLAKAEEQLRLEHEIAIEYKDIQKKKDKKELKTANPIGFKIVKPKRNKK